MNDACISTWKRFALKVHPYSFALGVTNFTSVRKLSHKYTPELIGLFTSRD
jgi:hypothetical protein